MAAALIRAHVAPSARQRLAEAARRTGRSEDEIIEEALECQLDLEDRRASPWWPFDAKLELTQAGRVKLEDLLAKPPRPTATLRRVMATGSRNVGKPNKAR